MYVIDHRSGYIAPLALYPLIFCRSRRLSPQIFPLIIVDIVSESGTFCKRLKREEKEEFDKEKDEDLERRLLELLRSVRFIFSRAVPASLAQLAIPEFCVMFMLGNQEGFDELLSSLFHTIISTCDPSGVLAWRPHDFEQQQRPSYFIPL
ncbi:hypothetical protein RRG08_008223 [Elysia crispata]|uniref:Uncharacterized protein n=1 Tax=Elysia crispata TaxID=231223 RepID=A0AAE0YC42_9GAST|nr:hypothetical protein RRG08_008223 [Elysia crispata]